MNCRGCANFDPEAPWLMKCDERVTVKNEHSYTDICDYFKPLRS